MYFSLFLTNREPEYYDYGHGESTESYESYGKEKCNAQYLSTKVTLYLHLIEAIWSI